MQHPSTGPGDWRLSTVVYAGLPGEIAVGLLSDGVKTAMGLRWCEGDATVDPWPGEGTGWFLVPFTFASAIGRSLAQLKAGGFALNEDGFSTMLLWLAEGGGIDDGLSY